MKKFFKNSKGFSLMELMMAVGIVGVASLGIADLMKTKSTINRETFQDYDINLVQGLVGKIMSEQTGCGSTLGTTAIGTVGAPPDPTAEIELTNVVHSSGGQVFDAIAYPGELSFGGSVRIDRIYLSDFALSDELIADGGAKFNAHMYLEMTKRFSAKDPAKWRTIRKKVPFPITIITNNTGATSGCETGVADISEKVVTKLCRSMNGAVQDPYNLADPRCDLKVQENDPTPAVKNNPPEFLEDVFFDPIDRTPTSPTIVAAEDYDDETATSFEYVQFLEEREYEFMNDNYLIAHPDTSVPAGNPASEMHEDRRTLQDPLEVTGTVLFDNPSSSFASDSDEAVHVEWVVDNKDIHFRCNANQVAVFGDDGPSCLNSTDAKCGNGFYAQGYSPNGRPICRPLVLSGNCTAQVGRIKVYANRTVEWECP